MPLRLPSLRSSVTRGFAAAGVLALAGLLAACGTATAAGNTAVATATCPTAPSLTNVSGSITAVSASSLTVKNSSGATTTLALDSTTRVSVNQSIPATSLTAGTSVLVLTDTNATTAKSIRVVAATGTGTGTGTGSGSGGFGGGRFGNGGTPRPGRTPSAGINTACARQFAGGQFGAGATSGSGFQGLRGTVDSCTATNITFDDAQGQTYSVAITSATTITKTAAGKVSDLAIGQNVQVAASKTNGQEVARTVTFNG